MKKACCFIIIFLMLFLISSCAISNASKLLEINDNISPELHRAISNSILSQNNSSYYKGETFAEGHIVLGQETKDEIEIIYALTSFSNYGFQNDKFISIAGGSNPVKMVFSNLGNGEYSLLEYKNPVQGDGYTSSLKEMFPNNLIKVVLNPPRELGESMLLQKKSYASEYLNFIGRGAQIGVYSDFESEFQRPETSVRASNIFISVFYDYPSWVGTLEKIENGIRYVYEKQWQSQDKNNENGVITFKKYDYETKTIQAEYIIEINNDNLRYSNESPNRDKELKLGG